MKIGFFITARLKSTRLKRKILLDLNGTPILDRIIERCLSVKGINGVVLCTSTNSEDAELENHAKKYNIEFFKGSEDDVLDRLLSAALHFKYDAFISITADNPLFSTEISEEYVKWNAIEHLDFIFANGLPIGCMPYFLSTKALQVATFMKQASDTEIWGPFVNRPDFFKVGYLSIMNSPFNEEKRLTCDYSEDYQLFEEIFNNFQSDKNPSTKEVLNLLRNNVRLWEYNKMHKQLSVSPEIINRIKMNFDNMKIKGLKYAKQINFNSSVGAFNRNITL